MPDEFPYDVFLSHSAKDKALVRPLAERLRADALPNNSQHSTFNSQPPRGSDWAQWESGTFRFRDPLNNERRFLPLRLDDAPIKGSGWFRKDYYVRWQFGVPPTGNASFAWVQHFIHQLAPHGMAA